MLDAALPPTGLREGRTLSAEDQVREGYVPSNEQRATFGEAVRRLREARGWSQHDLAERLGLVDSAVANWEQGGGARSSNVAALENLFGLEPGHLGWILGQSRPPAIHSPEDAIKADDRIPEPHKRTLLAHLAEVRKLTAEAAG
jgi:transcriptional regulator with XRE-family HTH domain